MLHSTFISPLEAFSAVNAFVLLLNWNLKDMRSSSTMSKSLWLFYLWTLRFPLLMHRWSVSSPCTPRVPFLYDWWKHTTSVYLTRARSVLLMGWGKPEGRKERKRSHSFRATEARPESKLFWGVVCPAWETAIVQVAPKDGGLLRVHLYGEGGEGEEWERDLNFC